MNDKRKDATRKKIKDAARRLFGERGIDSVSVREILSAANQRNTAAIGYYFQNKQALIKEVVAEGAEILDGIRGTLLDDLEESGEEFGVRDIVAILVNSMTMAAGEPGDDHYSRFFWSVLVSKDYSSAVSESLRSESAYRRLLAHIRTMLPYYSRNILNQRLAAMNLMLGAFFAVREVSVERSIQSVGKSSPNDHVWLSDTMIENLIDSCVGLLVQPSTITTNKPADDRDPGDPS